jgi:bifunctional DNase/RNase
MKKQLRLTIEVECNSPFQHKFITNYLRALEGSVRELVLYNKNNKTFTLLSGDVWHEPKK